MSLVLNPRLLYYDLDVSGPYLAGGGGGGGGLGVVAPPRDMTKRL